jgi:hypothetical protein
LSKKNNSYQSGWAALVVFVLQYAGQVQKQIADVVSRLICDGSGRTLFRQAFNSLHDQYPLAIVINSSSNTF